VPDVVRYTQRVVLHSTNESSLGTVGGAFFEPSIDVVMCLDDRELVSDEGTACHVGHEAIEDMFGCGKVGPQLA
jgi:hypothetical protein